MKCKKILAALLIVVMVATLAGCNYVDRPFGTANHGEDISGMLDSLLIIPTFVLEPAPTEKEENRGEDTIIIIDDIKPEEPEEPEEPVEPDPVYTPFTSTYDANTLLSKIDNLVATMKSNNGVANSATGVSDELLSNRSVKILVPDNFPLDEEGEAVKAITAQYGCAVNIRRMGTGSAYTAACRRAVQSGENVDLIYVDNASWGDFHPFTQRINSFINFDLAEELGTFSPEWTKQFYVADELETTIMNYYVASGIGAPYVLAYNKDNLAEATLKEELGKDAEGEETTLREVKVTDPAKMYDERTWGLSAMSTLLQASTKGSNAGIASKMDSMEGLDIWYGISGYSGLNILSSSGLARYVDSTTPNMSIDMIQNWYWSDKGTDNKTYVGSFADASDWEDGSVYHKLFNYYSGSDEVKSFSFVACEPEDFANINKVAEQTAGEWDFVAYPYADHMEDTYRTYSDEEFKDLLAADKEGVNDPEYIQQVHTPVAGWAGGFAVTTNCQSPSVALRVAEELTKVWQAEVESTYYAEMTEAQVARYDDMKENMSLSFVRAWAEKAADVNEVYAGAENYFNGNDGASSTLAPGTDPDAYASTRANYAGLKFFDNNSALAVHAMYHKNENNGIYNTEMHRSWSAFMSGSININTENTKDTGSVLKILNASLLPSTLMFEW